MSNTELETKPNKSNFIKFLNKIKNDKRRENAFVIFELMKKITKEEPKMWGESIVGFGSYHYKYESGREGDWFISEFSLRKSSLKMLI